MTQEKQDKELVSAVKQLAESQQMNACYLRKGRRLAEELRKASEQLTTELDVLDPASDVKDGGFNVALPDYSPREEVSKLLREYTESTKSAQASREFIRNVYPWLTM